MHRVRTLNSVSQAADKDSTYGGFGSAPEASEVEKFGVRVRRLGAHTLLILLVLSDAKWNEAGCTRLVRVPGEAGLDRNIHTYLYISIHTYTSMYTCLYIHSMAWQRSTHRVAGSGLAV